MDSDQAATNQKWLRVSPPPGAQGETLRDKGTGKVRLFGLAEA